MKDADYEKRRALRRARLADLGKIVGQFLVSSDAETTEKLPAGPIEILPATPIATLEQAFADLEERKTTRIKLRAEAAPEIARQQELQARLEALPQCERREVLDAMGLHRVSAVPAPLQRVRACGSLPAAPLPTSAQSVENEFKLAPVAGAAATNGPAPDRGRRGSSGDAIVSVSYVLLGDMPAFLAAEQWMELTESEAQYILRTLGIQLNGLSGWDCLRQRTEDAFRRKTTSLLKSSLIPRYGPDLNSKTDRSYVNPIECSALVVPSLGPNLDSLEKARALTGYKTVLDVVLKYFGTGSNHVITADARSPTPPESLSPISMSENPKQRRVRLLEMFDVEVAARGSRGALNRVTEIEKRTRPTADRSKIGKDVKKAREERDAERRGGAFARLVG